MRLTTTTDRLAVQARLSRGSAAALVIAMLLLVFGLDKITVAAPVQHLYYVPIILAGIVFRMEGGLSRRHRRDSAVSRGESASVDVPLQEADLVQMALFLAVGATTAKLAHDADRLRQLALTDDLTGLHNLRSFEPRLLTFVRASRATRTPLALLVLDVDRLKWLNDRVRTPHGRRGRAPVGQIIGERLPPKAVGCRYGGDEFVVAISRCDGVSRDRHRRRLVMPSTPAHPRSPAGL